MLSKWEEYILDIFEVIRKRGSVRWFKQDPIDDSTIMKILEAGIRAPTAMGMQQWFFVVVKDEKVREKVWKFLKKVHIFYYTRARVGSESFDQERMRKLQERLDKGMYRAPVYIAAYLHLGRRGLKDEYSEIEEMWGIESVSAAIENISLSAIALGLGTCWIGVVNFLEEEINEILKPPEGCKLIAILPLGFPLEPPKPKPRKGLEEVTKVI